MPRRYIVVEFAVTPGAYEAFSAIMREHARATKATEPGCTTFDVVRVTDASGGTDTSKLVLIEGYASEDAYLEHGKQPRMVKFRESYAGMVGDRRVVRGFVD